MENELTDRNALRESRKAVADILIQNIEDHDTLSYQRGFGTHGTADHVVPMGNANYLRYLAYAETHHQDIHHFLTQSEALKAGCTIPSDAHPLILERWTVDKDKKYHCFELPLYNIHDLLVPDEVFHAYRNLPSPFQEPSHAAVDKLFENANVLPKGVPHSNRERYLAMLAYTKKAVPDNPLAQKHLAYLLHKTTDVQLGYEDEPVGPTYTEEDVQHLKANPDLLFSSFSVASKEMHRIMEELRFLERQVDQERKAYLEHLDEEEKIHPLASLRVVYQYSDCPEEFTDKDGKVLPKEQSVELVGEDAYRFLVQVNHTDKKRYHQVGMGKTDFTLTFADKTYAGHYDLGSLCFENRKTVAEAMEAEMTAATRELLGNEAALRQRYDELRQYNPEGTKGKPEYASLEAYRQHLEDKLQRFHVFSQSFAEKETAFLQEHPEYVAINQEDAKPYIAICPASQLESLKKQGFVLDVLPQDSLKDFLSFRPNVTPTDNKNTVYALSAAIKGSDMGQNPSKHRLQKALPDGFVAFTTAHRPDMDFGWKEWMEPRYVIPKEDIEHLRAIQDLTVKTSGYIPSLHKASTKASTKSSSGILAIEKFSTSVSADDSWYKDAVRSQVYLPGYAPKIELALYAKDKPVYALSYQVGRGDLAKAAPYQIPPSLPEEYQASYETYRRYTEYSNRKALGKTYASLQSSKRHFPTLEDSRKHFSSMYHKPEKAKHPTNEWREEATQYYTNYALLDPAVDTPEEAVLGIIHEMAKDGYTEARIKSILPNTRPGRVIDTLAILKSAKGKETIRKARKEQAATQGTEVTR